MRHPAAGRMVCHEIVARRKLAGYVLIPTCTAVNVGPFRPGNTLNTPSAQSDSIKDPCRRIRSSVTATVVVACGQALLPCRCHSCVQVNATLCMELDVDSHRIG